MLVAASDHRVQAGTFLGALGAGQAAPLLLAWGGRREATSVRGQAFFGPLIPGAALWGISEQKPLSDTTPGTGKSPLGCTPSSLGTKPVEVKMGLGSISSASGPRWTSAQQEDGNHTIS